MTLTVMFEQELDGRWIASVQELRGVHVYGETREAALAKAQATAFEVLADEIAHGERAAGDLMTITFVIAQAA